MTLRIDYSSREFLSILDDIRQQLTTELPESNDFLESNVGRFILDAYAAIADMIAFTLDRQAAECYIDTLETRPSLVSLLALIGYQPANPLPEKTLVTLTLDAPAATTITLPTGSRLQVTSTGSPWATTSAGVWSTAPQTLSVPVQQGQWNTLTFTGLGAPYQRIPMTMQNIADGQVQVTVNGARWTQAPNNVFIGATADDLIYRLLHTAEQ